MLAALAETLSSRDDAVGRLVLVRRLNSICEGELVRCLDGVFLQSSNERKTSSPDSRAFFINPFMVLTAFSTFLFDVGYLDELVT